MKYILIISFCLLFADNSKKSSLEYELEINQLKTKILELEKELLQSKINKNGKKTRKTPNPNFIHKIDIGNSVVLGNPNAKVTITKFTDFQ